MDDDFMSIFREEGLGDMAADMGLLPHAPPFRPPALPPNSLASLRDKVAGAGLAEAGPPHAAAHPPPHPQPAPAPASPVRAYPPSQHILMSQPPKAVKRKYEEARAEDGTPYSPSKRFRNNRSHTTRLRQQKGLRHFSLKVCEKVETKEITTYNEVAEMLVKELTDPDTVGLDNKKVYDEKNIRRRVYDALNVLLAIGIISKDKKTISWVGLPSGVHEEVRELTREREERRSRLRRKREHLAELLQELVCLKNLVARNTGAEPGGRAARDQRLPLPFVMVQTNTRGGETDGEPNILIEVTEDRRQAVFSFADTFCIAEDKDVLRGMGLATISAWDLARLLPDHMAELYPRALVEGVSSSPSASSSSSSSSSSTSRSPSPASAAPQSAAASASAAAAAAAAAAEALSSSSSSSGRAALSAIAAAAAAAAAQTTDHFLST